MSSGVCPGCRCTGDGMLQEASCCLLVLCPGRCLKRLNLTPRPTTRHQHNKHYRNSLVCPIRKRAAACLPSSHNKQAKQASSSSLVDSSPSQNQGLLLLLDPSHPHPLTNTQRAKPCRGGPAPRHHYDHQYKAKTTPRPSFPPPPKKALPTAAAAAAAAATLDLKNDHSG